MASCCVCKKNVGMFEGGDLSFQFKRTACVNCKKHAKILLATSSSIEERDSAREYFKQYIEKGYLEGDVRKYVDTLIEKDLAKDLEMKKQKEKAAVRGQKMWNIMQTEDFIFSTTQDLAGFRIVKHCGVVYGETVFRHGFSAKLDAALENALVGLGSKELEGTVGLIETARDYAYEKMKNEAVRRGANAIVAIDSDETLGKDIMYIAVHGTAVKVIPYDDNNDVVSEEHS